ncbi:MFS transporter [Streptomyces sp. NPDC088387]|uniref:MFS transporter n=1 Tax=Streptomyces sp. NPDC088387 TaxID=3365859 RepID=UPI00382EFD81
MNTHLMESSFRNHLRAREGTADRSHGSLGFWIASSTLFLLLAQSGAPSPLYPVYQQQLHLASAATTAIFSIYICGLLLSLLTVGSLSDYVGRRPVILASALLSVASLLVFADAASLTVLLVARALQGVAVGAGMGAIGAAMIDLRPVHGARLAAVLNGALPPAGLAVGALASGFLVQDAPAPTVTVYVVFSVLLAVMAVMVVFIGERSPRGAVTASVFIPRLAVPRETRRIFGAVVGCMVSSWALAGLYLGMAPTIMVGILGISSHVVAGAAVAAVTGTGALTGIVGRNRDARNTMLVGAAALIIGPLLSMIALSHHSVWGFFASAPVAGVGFGAAFQGGLRLLLAKAPEKGRAGLLSMVYLVSYIALGVPAVIAGWLVPLLGLGTVIDGYAVFVIVVAVLALALQWALPRIGHAERVADTAESAE